MELKDFGFDISVSKYLEDKSYADGIDLADVYIGITKNNSNSLKKIQTKEIIRTKAENKAQKLAEINPSFRKLITEFELIDTNGYLIKLEDH